jgi:hypothetical protein
LEIKPLTDHGVPPMFIYSLQNMKAELWHDLVTIVFSDMRKWVAPEKVNITLISKSENALATDLHVLKV